MAILHFYVNVRCKYRAPMAILHPYVQHMYEDTNEGIRLLHELEEAYIE
jgi:hypothetical protein